MKHGSPATVRSHVGTAAPVRPGRAPLGGVLPSRVPVAFAGKKIAAALHARDSLKTARKYSGPAVITEYSATTIVTKGSRFWLDRWENMLIERSK